MTLPRYIRRCNLTISRSGATVLQADESLRIVFKIRRDAAPATQPSTIQIYNLSEASEHLISERGDMVRLEAGYQDDALALVAMGEVRRIDSERVDLDRVTTIQIGQSDSKQKVPFVASYNIAPLPTIVADIVAAMGLSLHTSSLNAVTSNFVEVLRDWSFIGRAKDALTTLLLPRGIRWYEQNEEIAFAMTDAQVVAPIDLFTRQNVAPTFVHVISEASGMIGSPAPTEKGVKFKTLLDPSIVQNQRVRIQSEAINGDFTTITVLHVGDTRESEFATEVEAIGVL